MTVSTNVGVRKLSDGECVIEYEYAVFYRPGRCDRSLNTVIFCDADHLQE